MKTAMIAAVAFLILAGPARAGQDAHPSFTVGTATAQRGQRAYGVLKVPAGSDAGCDIPVAVLHGARPGPVRDGVFHASVDRDAHVAKGATIGFVTDYLNRPLQEVTAPEPGIVMFIRAVPSLKKGDTMVNIGVVSTQAR